MPYRPLLPLLSSSKLSLALSLSLSLSHPQEHTPRHRLQVDRPIVSGIMAALAHGGRRSAAAMVALLVALALAGVASGDFAADRAECANQLMGLATCLTFVQDKATARAPTPDCCAGLKQVVAASKKCLCVLVKDRDEPALGFKINVTRAMDLPSLCNYPATFSDCPQILGMSPDAPEAEIFKEYARKHESQNGTAAIPAAATGAAGGKSATSSSPAGGAGAGSQPGAVVVYLASSALVSFVSVLA